MTNPATALMDISDPARFGEAFRIAGGYLDLTPKQVWILCDATFYCHAAGIRRVDTALAMADMHTQSAAIIATFHLYLLDLHTVTQEQHDAMLRTIDPSFDPDGASE